MSKFLSGKSARVTAVAMGSAAIMAVGASAASATTVLGGGAAVPSGTAVGGPLSGSATLTVTGGGGGTATCTAGNLAGTTGTNGGASVPLTPTAFNLSTCTDTIPAFDILSAALSSTSPGTGSIVYNGVTSPQGTLNIANPTIVVRIRTSSGAPGSCNFTINNANNTASAALANANNSATFSAVPVATTGLCASATPATFSATFRPLTVTSSAALLTVAP